MATQIDVSELPNRFLKNMLKLKEEDRDVVESLAKILVKVHGESTGSTSSKKKKASKKKASKKKASKKKAGKKKASKKRRSKKRAGKKAKTSDGGFGSPIKKRKKRSSGLAAF